MIRSLNWYTDGAGAQFGLMMMGLVLLALSVNGVRKVAPVARLLPWAILWHLTVFAFSALWLLPYYADESDTLGYHNEGIEVARMVRDGAWGSINWGLSTKAVTIIVGFLYAPFGADIYGILFFSTVLGFAGCLYLCRAFNLWAAPAQTAKYSLIVLFLPSIAMWTGSIGKDSWIAFGLGLAAYGYSSIHRASIARGIWHFIGGFAIMAIIRPHIALAIAMSMAVAYLWGLTRRAQGAAHIKIFRMAVLLVMVGVLYPLTRDFVGISGDDTAGSADEILIKNGESNAVGGSEVEVQIAPGLAGAVLAFPRGVIRELFEPFPWEVQNINSALAALENVFIGLFVLTHIRRLGALLRQIVRVPYFLFAGCSALVLLVIFSFLPNLGLISRQRAQLLPFLFAPLVAAEANRKRQRRYSGVADAREGGRDYEPNMKSFGTADRTAPVLRDPSPSVL